MFYKFPIINHVSQIIEAIAGKPEFVGRVCEITNTTTYFYMVNFEDTFTPVTDERTALLRECRGISFDNATGKVVNRRFHKFRNVNETAEMQVDNIDFTQSHLIMQKLDGSMLSPMRTVDGQIRWSTKKGLTEVAVPVDAFTSDKPNYLKMCDALMRAGNTALFEWCSRTQKIVLDYPEDRLVLTAIRDNVTGEYVTYDAMVSLGKIYDIPVVEVIDGSVDDVQKFLKDTYAIEGAEGYIVRFSNGHMVKVKGDWYCQLHRTIEHFHHEKDIIRLILDEKLDDAKPFLPADLVEAADQFAKAIYENLYQTASKIFWVAQAAHDNFNGGKKRFVTEMILVDPALAIDKGLYFNAFDNIEKGEKHVFEVLINDVKNHTGTQTKVNHVRRLFGDIKWQDFKGAVAVVETDD